MVVEWHPNRGTTHLSAGRSATCVLYSLCTARNRALAIPDRSDLDTRKFPSTGGDGWTVEIHRDAGRSLCRDIRDRYRDESRLDLAGLWGAQCVASDGLD